MFDVHRRNSGAMTVREETPFMAVFEPFIRPVHPLNELDGDGIRYLRVYQMCLIKVVRA
jgi:hypothetical protein